jgi:cytochrome b561
MNMNSHTFLAKTIHWTFSILYAYGIIKQVDDLDELEDASLLNFEIIFVLFF